MHRYKMRRGLFILCSAFAGLVASAFDLSAKSNVVLYFGQEGGTLASVCQDDSVDVVALAFLTDFFGTGGLPVVNFAGSCNGATFPGTDLLECTEIGQDIQTCQDAGKVVLLSLGGAIGNYGFSSSSEAQTFATTLWQLFGEGSSDTRPFGTSVIDGFDLDIENQQPDFYSDFISAMRTLFDSGSKQYYISGAPQCVFPDASLGDALDGSSFDMVFVQFYNNPPCGVEGSGFNYDTWQSWASGTSPNKDVKVFVGVPGSTAAAGSGYITPEALSDIISSVVGQDNFGGVMMWDANQAFANVNNGVNYAQAAKSALVGVAGNSSSASGSQGQNSVVTVAAAPATTAKTAAPVASPATTVSEHEAGASATTLRTVTVTHNGKVAAANKGVVSDTNDGGAIPEASVTATAGSASASAVSSSGSCTSGVIDCIGGQFAQCVNSAWVLTSCPSETTCTKIGVGDSQVITCDYITSSRKHKRNNAKRHVHAHRQVVVDVTE